MLCTSSSVMPETISPFLGRMVISPSCSRPVSYTHLVYQAAGLSASRVVTAVAIPVWVVYVACFVRRKRRSTCLLYTSRCV